MASMRIIGGSAGGRTLKAPAGAQTRPTSDRVREALFSILGAPPEGAQILDLFAGSGGLGLEALSRGAHSAVFVDQNSAALQVLKQNIEDLEFGDSTEVHRGDAPRHLKRLAKGARSFHWIFIDPPYASDLAGQCLEILASASLLSEEGQIVVEHDRRSAPDEVYGSLVRSDSRRYGDTSLSFYERISE
jgi:16S rRNA (guanine(966)-N(2))-methyltransferase RsmD